MRRHGWMALVLLVLGTAAPWALSQDRTYKDEAEEAAAFNVTRTTKTVAGLNFRVEEDRPIEKVGGIYRPIDIDSYVALKISKLQQQMQEMVGALTRRLEALEADVAALKAVPARPGAAAPAVNATAAQAPAANVSATNVTAVPVPV